MRATIDTNVFVYMLDARDPKKQSAAMELVERLRARTCAISLQTCGELYAALTRRLRRAPWEAAQASRNLLAAFPVFGSSRTAVERALAEAMAARFGYWDALLLASAHEASCELCFSEDMADGARLGHVEVVAPFGPTGLSDRARAILERID
ncbi:MAG TPA: PIN domain-containing protein [Myxococcales bacterium]|nr:PIN domain-containing protein [Myxococcales bacterium]